MKSPDLFDSLTQTQQETLTSIVEQYLADLEQGVRADPQQLMDRHPDLAEPLRYYLGSLDFLQRAAGEIGNKHASADGLPFPDVAATDGSGQKRIGDFEIVREIGRGGMGIVYEAIQESLGRRVALKVLPFAAVLDAHQIARFKNEAQAAAQLHHPNIVPVYSVGCDRGVHYYSMQFVDGQSLDHAINQLQSRINDTDTDSAGKPIVGTPIIANDGSTLDWEKFSTQRSIRSRSHVRSVVELVIQAAHALHHAHAFGVVHRDVKPSNLMLDHQGKLWVTDFGLARCQTSTQLTMSGDLLGTIRYMCPEQAAGRGSLVDHVSDVYSLGVTLYELLTLRPPHSEADRIGLLDSIQNQTPQSPREINPVVAVDLETIVFKAIAKSRDERYESAQALAEDLTRFLEGKPPLAQRPTKIDLISKWASRHRTLVASVVGGLFLTSLVTGGSAMMLSKEKKRTENALAIAQTNFEQSQDNLRKSIEVVDRFGMRMASRLAGIPGAESVRQTILQETLSDYEQFAARMQDDESMRIAHALCHTQIGSMLRQLGQLAQSIDHYGSAIETFGIVLSETQDSGVRKRLDHDVAVCHNNLGELYFQQGDLKAAEKSYRQSLDYSAGLMVTDPQSLSAMHVRAAAMVNAGNLYRASNRVEKAVATYNDAIALQQSLCERAADNSDYRRDLAVSYAQLSFLLTADDLAKAEQYNQRAVDIHQEFVTRRPDDIVAIAELATCYNHRGAIFHRRHDTPSARVAYQSAIELQEKLVARAPTAVRFQEQLAVGHNNLAQMLIDDSQTRSESLEHFRSAKTLLEKLVVTSPQSPHYRAQLGGVLANVASLLDSGEPQTTREHYEQAIEHLEWAVGRAAEIQEFRLWLSSSYVNYGRFLRAQGETDMAGQIALRRRELWPQDPDRLYRVTIELAQTAAASRKGLTSTDSLSENPWIDAAVATWNRAVDSGLLAKEPTQLDPAIELLKNHPEFRIVGNQP
jgi:eukaryotic-like serine/threonine-protein kinase